MKSLEDARDIGPASRLVKGVEVAVLSRQNMEQTLLVQKWIFAAWHRTVRETTSQASGTGRRMALQADPKVCARGPTVVQLHRSEGPLPATNQLTNSQPSAGVAAHHCSLVPHTRSNSNSNRSRSSRTRSSSSSSFSSPTRPQDQSPNVHCRVI